MVLIITVKLWSETAPNEPGWQVRTIPNNFPVLTVEENLKKQGCGIYDHISGFGAHEVIIDTPEHQKSTKDFTGEEIQKVFVMLQSRMEDLFRDERIRSCFIVKNDTNLCLPYVFILSKISNS